MSRGSRPGSGPRFDSGRGSAEALASRGDEGLELAPRGTPDLDEMERCLPSYGYYAGDRGSGSGIGSRGGSGGGGSDRGMTEREYDDGSRDVEGNADTAHPRIGPYGAYPPEPYEDEPDAATALLGGRRKTFRSRIGTLGRGGSQLFSARVPLFGFKVPCAFFLVCPFLILLFTLSRARGPSYTPLPLLSNGTHAFHPTTLVVSIDGFRPSYLSSHAKQVPHLRSLAKDGVYGEMTPVFPTLTFPNHWSLLTGLYPSSHGIVANRFHRPGEGEFDYASPEHSWQGHWWRGEPAWSVVERQGRRALNFMWPGPPTTSAGVSPSFFVPYASWDTTTKYAKLLEYFDMPVQRAPSLLFMYLPDVDQAGHGGGPESDAVSDALVRVDTFVGDLRAEIARRNMSDIVDLIVLSDHGMAALSEKRLIFLDDILGGRYKDIKYKDGWPTYGLWFAPGVDYAPHLAVLQKAAATMNFTVYTHDTMPQRWHLAGPDHIAPVYLVPDLGWQLTDHEEWDMYGFSTKGAHGFDNVFPEMHAAFFAHGPAAARMKTAAKEHGDKWSSVEPAVMKPFNNLEIFGLVARLQMCEAPPHNGTAGFWDDYLGKE